MDLDDLWEPHHHRRRHRTNQPSNAEAVVKAIGYLLILGLVLAALALALLALAVCGVGWSTAELARRQQAAAWWRSVARRIARRR
jgi:hypothetical protein